MTVWAKGQTFVCESDYADGDPWTDETRATWKTVEAKLENFCSKLMSASQMRELVDQVRNLESIDDVSKTLAIP